MSKLKILVTDAWTRKSLSAVRALGRKGFEVYCVSHKRWSPALYSTFTTNYFISPHPEKQFEEYKIYLTNLLLEQTFDVIIPFEEITMEFFYEWNELDYRPEGKPLLTLPPKPSYEIAKSKERTLVIAKELGIPIPKTSSIQNVKDINLEEINLPVLIKPSESSGSRGLVKVYEKEKLVSEVENLLKNYSTLLLQELLPVEGKGVGVGLISKNGNCLQTFTYERLREFPVNGGPSTLRASTYNTLIEGWARLLMERLQWTGVAMVEFKMNTKTGEPVLMEINPRFWGSMELPEVCGISFVNLYVDLAIGKEIKSKDYPVGRLCRWLIPGDIAHFIINNKRWKLQPSFFKFFDKELYYDDFSIEDWKGNLAVLWTTCFMLFDWELWKLGIFRKK